MKYAINLRKNVFTPVSIPQDVHVEYGQMILVLTEKGEEAFPVYIVNSQIEKMWDKKSLQPLKFIKVLSKEDLETLKNIRNEEIESKLKCEMLIQKHKLNMRLTTCRITFDRKKISFYYTAPERVDFRELLKSLTQTFKRMRIDLKHIGVRDEAALLDGCGACGRQMCCASFLRKFEATSIKLAKDQGCPVTPGKVSGICGRLLCCLNYEYETYIEAAKDMPPVGSAVLTPDGLGKVFAIRFLTSRVGVKFEDGKLKDYDKQSVEVVDADVNVEIMATNQMYADDDSSGDYNYTSDEKDGKDL